MLVELLSNHSKQITHRLNTFKLRCDTLVLTLNEKHFVNTVKHDLSREHLFDKELTDEFDVSKHSFLCHACLVLDLSLGSFCLDLIQLLPLILLGKGIPLDLFLKFHLTFRKQDSF